MKIVVLAGGTSTEREVSIVTGTGVCKALRERGHQAVLLDVFFGLASAESGEVFTDDYDVDQAAAYMRSFDGRLEQEKVQRREFFGPQVIRLCQAADIVFMALHGSNGEDGKVQAAFDLYGIRYTGTEYLSSAIAMNKSLTKQFFRAWKVPTPGGAVFNRNQKDIGLEANGLKLPVVVKPCCGGSSVGITIARTDEEYEQSLKEAFSYEDQIVVEEYIDGREFSVAVIGGKAYPVIEIAPKEGVYDYHNKYQAGSTVETCPAELSPDKTREMQEYAKLGTKALGITGYCRLDFMMDQDEKMYCLEANTLPGMTPTSLIPQEAEVLGESYPELCEKLIRISLEKYQEQVL